MVICTISSITLIATITTRRGRGWCGINGLLDQVLHLHANTILAVSVVLLGLRGQVRAWEPSPTCYEPPEGLRRAWLAVSSDFRYLSSLT
jgi:hypothetical protein